MIFPSFSKVNIGLKITGRRRDGYHTIHTVFQELDFGDRLSLEKRTAGCSLSSNVGWLPVDQNNICHQAYSVLKSARPDLGGVSIHIEKNVPSGAGLGGGSANAAATLRGINELYDLNITPAELEKLGVVIGADVPFFIRGGTQIGNGIGDILTPVSPAVQGFYVLVFPKVSISTAWAYGKVKNILQESVETIKFTRFFSEKYTSFEIFENDFERIVIPAYPEIGTIKEKLLDLGAGFASLSGSGSTVFGIFNEEVSAREAELSFLPSHKTLLARPTNL